MKVPIKQTRLDPEQNNFLNTIHNMTELIPA